MSRSNFLQVLSSSSKDRDAVHKVLVGANAAGPETPEDMLTAGYAPPKLLLKVAKGDVAKSPKDDRPALVKQLKRGVRRLFEGGVGDLLYQTLSATGPVSWRDACMMAQLIDNTCDPGFHAKELVQDLLDLPWVCPGGRNGVFDLKTHSPSGPGARRGLAWVFNLGNPHSVAKKMTHAEAESLLKALYSEMEKTQKRSLDGFDNLEVLEELHDLQGLMCEIAKFLAARNWWPRRGLALVRTSQGWQQPEK